MCLASFSTSRTPRRLRWPKTLVKYTPFSISSWRSFGAISRPWRPASVLPARPTPTWRSMILRQIRRFRMRVARSRTRVRFRRSQRTTGRPNRRSLLIGGRSMGSYGQCTCGSRGERRASSRSELFLPRHAGIGGRHGKFTNRQVRI